MVNRVLRVFHHSNEEQECPDLPASRLHLLLVALATPPPGPATGSQGHPLPSLSAAHAQGSRRVGGGSPSHPRSPQPAAPARGSPTPLQTLCHSSTSAARTRGSLPSRPLITRLVLGSGFKGASPRASCHLSPSRPHMLLAVRRHQLCSVWSPVPTAPDRAPHLPGGPRGWQAAHCRGLPRLLRTPCPARSCWGHRSSGLAFLSSPRTLLPSITSKAPCSTVLTASSAPFPLPPRLCLTPHYH